MKPLVLCFSGHDPSGGAGIQADIESINQTGARAMSVVTALTSQNTQKVYDYLPTGAHWISKQAKPILTEFNISAIKIGMTGSVDNIYAIADIIKQYPAIPVIFDPVLKSGSKDSLADNKLALTMIEELVPLTDIITPNLNELNSLGNAIELLNHGVKNVLVTNTNTHLWFALNADVKKFNYPLLPCKYHGSGCTLAASISSYIAQKLPVALALQKALDYTWQTLKNSKDTSGQQQILPDRT